MIRMMIALGLLFSFIGESSAGTWNGAAVAGLDAPAMVEKVGCNRDDYYCPWGRYRACQPGYGCWCARCAGPRYYDQPRYYEPPGLYGGPGLMFQFGGRGGDDRRYSPPVNGRCPRNYTIQDGLCKPYTGR